MKLLAIGLLSVSILLLGCGASTQKAATENSYYGNEGYREDISLIGTWEVSMSTPRGAKRNSLTITEEDGQLIGRTEKAEVSIRRSGSTVSWDQTLDTPRGKINAAFSGQIIDNNTMEGKTLASGRQLKWAAKRK